MFKVKKLYRFPLEWSVDKEFEFPKIRFTDFPIYSWEKRFPEIHNLMGQSLIYDSEFKDFKVVSSTMQSKPRDYFLFKTGFLDVESYVKRYNNSQLKDTLIIYGGAKPKYQINAISAFEKNEQIIIPDLNNNGNFNDDPTLKFPREFSSVLNKSETGLDSLPILDFAYQFLSKGKIHDINRKIRIYPNASHNHAYLTDRFLDSTLNSYTLMLQLVDYGKGKVEIDNVEYTIAVQGKNPRYATVVIKPDTVNYPKDNMHIQKIFSFGENDTLQLGNGFYTLNEVSPDFSSLRFTKISTLLKFESKSNELRYGQILGDFIIEGLSGSKIELSKKLNEKKYVLVNFWGTWCGPCHKKMPEIQRLYELYAKHVGFLGVAYDKDIDEVKRYVLENRIEWEQGFVNRNESNNHSIIKKCNITSFPTFILLEENGKIIHIGGSSALRTIEKIIKENITQ